MHAAYARDTLNAVGEGRFRASFPEPVPVAETIALPPPPSAYGERTRPNWMAIAAILAVHALVLIALVTFDVIEIAKKPPPLLVVDLMAEPPAPPPPAAVLPEVAPVKPAQPRIVAPPPLVQTPAPPPQVAVIADAPPPQTVVVVPAAPKATVAVPVAVDLAANLVSFKAPRYPVESRKKREEGTVTLSVTVGPDGSVTEIAVAKSSGFERLDKAALDAVRHWRWKPMIRGGEAVAVKGYMPFPFVLQG